MSSPQPTRPLARALELVPNVTWNKEAPNVEAILRSRPVERHDVGAGTVYLLKTSTTMHRVAPLRRDATRVALCFSYASPFDLKRSISHETVDRIYGLPKMTANG